VTTTRNSPFSVQTVNKVRLAEDGQEATTNRRMMTENGHPGVAVDEAAIRKGDNPYTRYYQQQGEQPVPAAAPVCVVTPLSLSPRSNKFR
jgi:pre-mRNA-processing factor 39